MNILSMFQQDSPYLAALRNTYSAPQGPVNAQAANTVLGQKPGMSNFNIFDLLKLNNQQTNTNSSGILGKNFGV